MTQQRDTRQRFAIRQALEASRRPLSPKEVLEAASAQVPNLGIATVYRNIKAMLDQGELDSVEIPGQAPRYQLPAQRKQHLFICTRSDRVFTFDHDTKGFHLTLPANLEAEKVQLIVYGVSAEEGAAVESAARSA